MSEGFDYASLSDEELVLRYQTTKDESAVTELYGRYEDVLRKKADLSNKKSKRISVETFLSKLHDKFISAVNTFDANKGVKFAHFLMVKIYRFDYEVIRDTLYSRTKDDSGRLIRKMKHPVTFIDHYEQSYDMDAEERSDTSQRLQTTIDDDPQDTRWISDQLRYIRVMGGEIDYKAAVMRFQGYTYEEIAKALGKDIKTSTGRSYVKRALDRVKTLLVDFYAMVGEPERLAEYNV